jgi:hypothetical protein
MRLHRSLLSIAASAALAMGAAATGVVATAAPAGAVPVCNISTDPAWNYSEDGLRAAQEVYTQLDKIGWPSEDTYNYYPGKKGHADMTSEVVWGNLCTPTSYVAKTKCAAFVTDSLKHAYGPGSRWTDQWATDTYFTQTFGSDSPTATQYYDVINANGSTRISKVTDLDLVTRGDLIMIKYPSADSTNGDPTGHVMFFVDRQAVDKDGNPATLEWAVRVIDATSNPHGVASTNPNSTYLAFPDTRAVGTTEYAGAGTGTIVLRTDADGTVLGYWWGINENVTSEWHPATDRPIIFGHLSQTTGNQS